MIFKDYTKKIIVLAITLGIMANFGLPLKQAEAFVMPVMEVGPNLAANVTSAAMTTAQKILYFLKEFIIYSIVRKIANALENKLLNKMTGLISGLTQRTPSFILSWRNFQLDSQARGNDVFRAVLADANLCPYFKNGLRTAFGADRAVGTLAGADVKVGTATVFQQKTGIPGLPSLQNLTNCTLPASLNSTAAINAYKNDFSKGGWTAWNQLIQPQNNFFGAYSLALGEQQRQIETELQSSRDKSIAGQGFLGQALGRTGGASPTGCVGASLPGVQRFSANENGELTNITRCAFMGKEVTPAKVLGETAVRTLDKKLGRVGGATQITDVVLSILNAVVNGLTNRVLNYAQQASYQVRPSYSPQPTPDGGADFSTTNAPKPEEEPTFNACGDACKGELNTCRSIVPVICVPGPIDPVTGQPGPDICEPDPDNEANCQASFNNCIAQCPTTP